MRENLKEIVTDCLERIVGLTKDELKEAEEEQLNFIEDDILDSLSIVALLGELEEKLGKKLNIANFESGDFNTVDRIVDAVSRML